MGFLAELSRVVGAFSEHEEKLPVGVHIMYVKAEVVRSFISLGVMSCSVVAAAGTHFGHGLQAVRAESCPALLWSAVACGVGGVGLARAAIKHQTRSYHLLSAVHLNKGQCPVCESLKLSGAGTLRRYMFGKKVKNQRRAVLVTAVWASEMSWHSLWHRCLAFLFLKEAAAGERQMAADAKTRPQSERADEKAAEAARLESLQRSYDQQRAAMMELRSDARSVKNREKTARQELHAMRSVRADLSEAVSKQEALERRVDEEKRGRESSEALVGTEQAAQAAAESKLLSNREELKRQSAAVKEG